MKRIILFSSLTMFVCCIVVSMLMVGCNTGSDDDSVSDSDSVSAPFDITPLYSVSYGFPPMENGSGCPEAAAYDSSQPGPHKVVILTWEGGWHVWNEALPNEWSASSVEETELVAFVSWEYTFTMVSCPYNTGPNIDRLSYAREVHLFSARTGSKIAEEVLTGSEPPECPASAPIDQTSVIGGQVAYATLQTWLQTYVE